MEELVTYDHAEAFCLMTYRCERCGTEECIWNSRDGVTPFLSSCPIEGCEGTTKHINWGDNARIPDYILQPGDRFWRDGTDDEARESIRRIVMTQVQYIPEGRTVTEVIDEMSARIGTERSDFRKGWPKLEMVPLEIAPA